MLEGRCLCGQARWTYHGMPDRATICNCNACRRYGVIWIYGVRGEELSISGETRGYVRSDADGDLAFHTCAACGCPHSWQPAEPPGDGGYRMAVNLRLAEPQAVAALPLRRFDGLESWSDRPSFGACVGDFWAWRAARFDALGGNARPGRIA